jgi:hypothetical protein
MTYTVQTNEGKRIFQGIQSVRSPSNIEGGKLIIVWNWGEPDLFTFEGPVNDACVTLRQMYRYIHGKEPDKIQVYQQKA